MPPPFKKFRCKWYNNSGHPRINPWKLEQDVPDPTGCRFTAWKCNYVHPDDHTWETAQYSKPPKAQEYPDNQVPRTPSPLGRVRRIRSPEPRVKYEPQSPRLPRNGQPSDRSRTLSQEFRRDSLLDRVDNRPPPSPYPLDRGRSAERVWETNKSHRTPQDFSRDRANSDREEGYISDRERTESNNDLDRASDRGSERSREFIRSPVRRNSKATRPIFSVKPISLDGHVHVHKRAVSGDKKGSTSPSLLERMASAPRQPRALDRAIDRNPLPPPDPPPSVPPPPPFSPSRPSSRSNSNSFMTAGPPPESTMPSTRSSMPPPPTPISATSTATTFQPTLPPKPAFLNPSDDSVKKESLTREERLKIWGERIELIFGAGDAKRAYNDCVTDVKEKQFFSTPERTERLGDAARESIMRSLQAAEAKRETARARSLSTHEKLLDLDFWPVRRRPELSELVKREEEEKVIEDGHAEVKKQASELGDALSRIDRQLKEVTQFVASRTKSNAVPTSVSMDWEPTDATAARGPKRRKVGEDGAYASDSGSTTLGRASPSPALSASAVSASAALARQNRQNQKRLTKLESDFHELENLYMQSERDAQEELASQIDHYVDSRREEFVKRVKAERLARVTRLEEKVKHMDEDVQEAIEELTHLIGAEAEMKGVINNMMEEQARAEAEGARVRAALIETTSRGNDLQAQREAQLKEWEIIKARLASLEKEKEKNRSSSHLPSPESPSSSDPSLPPAHTPTLQHLFTLLFPHVLAAIRTRFVAPHLVETKAEVVQIMREQLHESLHQERSLVEQKLEKITKASEVLAQLQSAGMLGVNGVGSVGSVTEEGGHAGININGTHTQVNGNGNGNGTSEPTTNSPPMP